MNGDLITGAAGVDSGGHLIGKQVKTPPGELDAGQREHPGELAGHIHLLGFTCFHLEKPFDARKPWSQAAFAGRSCSRWPVRRPTCEPWRPLRIQGSRPDVNGYRWWQKGFSPLLVCFESVWSPCSDRCLPCQCLDESVLSLGTWHRKLWFFVQFFKIFCWQMFCYVIFLKPRELVALVSHVVQVNLIRGE